MSSITLIGTGNMARTIGTLAVSGGNTVEVMGRDQSRAIFRNVLQKGRSPAK